MERFPRPGRVLGEFLEAVGRRWRDGWRDAWRDGRPVIGRRSVGWLAAAERDGGTGRAFHIRIDSVFLGVLVGFWVVLESVGV